MRHTLFRLTFAALLTFIVVVLSVGLMQKAQIQEFIRVNIPQLLPSEKIEIEYSCPKTLAIYYFIDIKDTKSFEDDEVFIAILTAGDKNYEAEVFVNGISEGEITITEQKTALKSKLITDWWRQGLKEPPSQEEETEDSVEEDNQDKQTFFIDVAIEGCNKTMASLTPTMPSIVPIVGGGGSASSSDAPISSRYSISIAKSQSYYLPD